MKIVSEEILCVPVVLDDGTEMFVSTRELSSSQLHGYLRRDRKHQSYPEPIRDERVHVVDDARGREQMEYRIRRRRELDELQRAEASMAREYASQMRDATRFNFAASQFAPRCPVCGCTGGAHQLSCPGLGRYTP
jgi:hypothetical protein